MDQLPASASFRGLTFPDRPKRLIVAMVEVYDEPTYGEAGQVVSGPSRKFAKLCLSADDLARAFANGADVLDKIR